MRFSKIKAQIMLTILTIFLIYFSFVASERYSFLAFGYVFYNKTIQQILFNSIVVYFLAFIGSKILPAKVQKIISKFVIVLLGLITLILTPMQLNSSGFFGGYLPLDPAAILVGCIGILIAIGQLLTIEKQTQVYSNKFAVAYLIFIDMFLFDAFLR